MTPEQIEKVLAMSEGEQRAWLLINVFHERMPRESTADLAFRLRDEAVEKDAFEWTKACESVFLIASPEPQWSNYDIWWQDYSKSIHWILGALLAKGDE